MVLRQQHLAAVGARLNNSHPGLKLARNQQEPESFRHRLETTMRWQLERQTTRVTQARRALQAVSPLATLERGHALVLDTAGHTIRSEGSIAKGNEVAARLADGSMRLKRLDGSAVKKASN